MRIRSTLVALTALPLIVLAACGTDAATTTSATSTSGTSGSASAGETVTATASDAAVTDSASTGSASTEAPASESAATDLPTDAPATGGSEVATSAAVQGPEEPPATAVAAPAPDAEMPTATGDFGDTPVLTFPEGEAPSGLQQKILVEGDGAVVAAGDLLVADYVGQVWGAETFFDSSFDRGDKATPPGRTPTGFTIGKQQVVNGWDVGLVGLKVGTRVLLSLPPQDGYGATGNEGAGILGTDTIVFVVDIVNTFSAKAGGQADAKPVTPAATEVTITGDLGAEPTIKVNTGVPEPKENKFSVVATGTGDPIEDGKNAVFQVVAVPWDGTEGGSSWKDEAIQQAPISPDSILKDMIGVPIGSRILLLVPSTPADEATQNPGSPASAYVIDVVGQY